ncbi:MAG: SUMF1/EgtB/PvdO family nonheme iron enzyme [Polyangiaceae bacterium]
MSASRRQLAQLRPLVPLFVVATLGVACSARDTPASLGRTELTHASREAHDLAEAASPVAAKPLPETGSSPATDACPDGMVLASGSYCPEVEQPCEQWMDPPGTKYAHFRCKKYGPSVCKGARVPMRFCIDRTERREASSELPAHFVSFDAARGLCAKAGARVCTESEWQFACEGEAMLPYPYGYERDSKACNVDTFEGLRDKQGKLADHRKAVGASPACTSPFGVVDMAGNVEEWVRADGAGKSGWKQVLKGSYWIPSRHACRQFQVGHGPEYGGQETGTRCCREVGPPP